MYAIMGIFQSTRPARGATLHARQQSKAISISIHAPREGRDVVAILATSAQAVISIHAPREGRDIYVTDALRIVAISIHAPREGRDVARANSLSYG